MSSPPWGAMTDLCERLIPPWVSWARVCAGVTLTLILHISEPPPPHPPGLCPGGLSLGGSVKVGVCFWAEGTTTLPWSFKLRLHWIWEKCKPLPPNFLTEAGIPRSLLPRPTSLLLANPRLCLPPLPLLLSVHYKQS